MISIAKELTNNIVRDCQGKKNHVLFATELFHNRNCRLYCGCNGFVSQCWDPRINENSNNYKSYEFIQQFHVTGVVFDVDCYGIQGEIF